jgi:hypothetical protein
MQEATRVGCSNFFEKGDSTSMILRITVSSHPWNVNYTVTMKGAAAPAIPPRKLERVGDFPAPPTNEKLMTAPTPEAASFLKDIANGNSGKLDQGYRDFTYRNLTDTVPLACYLYQTLLGEVAGRAVTKFLGTAPTNGQVEIQLVWPSTEDLLTRLPWELMRNETEFLAAIPRVVISRRVEVPIAPPPPPTHLRVLFVVGTNPHERKIEAGSEYLGVIQAVTGSPFNSELLIWADRDRLSEAVRRFRPSVVHFIGHGARNAAGVAQVELCNKDRTSTELVSGTDLAALLDAASPGSNRAELPWLVVVNACHEASTNQEDTSLVVGRPVAIELLQKGVPVVVGMSGRVTDQACRLFARKLYESLLSDKSQHLVAAAAAGRVAGLKKYKGTLDPCTSVDWAMPVIFVNDRVKQYPSLAPTQVQRNWHEAVQRLRSPAKFPPVCGRMHVYDCLMRLLEPLNAPRPPVARTLRFLILSSNTANGNKYGRTWLMEEFAASIARSGHLPVVLVHTSDQQLAVSIRETATRIGEAIRDTYTRFQFTTVPNIRCANLPTRTPSLRDVVAAIREDLTDLRQAARTAMGRQDMMLVLLADNLHLYGSEGVKLFLSNPNGLLEVNGIASDDGFRAVFSYETNPPAGLDVLVNNDIVSWVNNTSYIGQEVPLTQFAAIEENQAYLKLLLNWKEPQTKVLTPYLPTDPTSLVNILNGISSFVDGVPSMLPQLSPIIKAFVGAKVLSPVTDSDAIAEVTTQGGQ